MPAKELAMNKDLLDGFLSEIEEIDIDDDDYG